MEGRVRPSTDGWAKFGMFGMFARDVDRSPMLSCWKRRDHVEKRRDSALIPQEDLYVVVSPSSHSSIDSSTVTTALSDDDPAFSIGP